jgi:HEAT repeat protein
LFRLRRKKPDFNKLKIELLKSAGAAAPDNKKLSELSPEQRWELVKALLPEREKNKTRDLVRLLLAKDILFLKKKIRDSKEKKDRYDAIECLGYLPSRETVEILVGLLKNTDDEVQLCAAGALKKQPPRLVVPYLIKAMLHAAVLPARAGEVLLAMGSLAQETILEVYPLALPAVKAHFLELLVQAENPKCKPVVIQALKSGNPQITSRALDAVALFQFDDLWPEVAGCLPGMPWAVKAKGLDVLGELGVKEARDYIAPFLEDEDEWVRQRAQICLQKLENTGSEEREGR